MLDHGDFTDSNLKPIEFILLHPNTLRYLINGAGGQNKRRVRRFLLYLINGGVGRGSGVKINGREGGGRNFKKSVNIGNE